MTTENERLTVDRGLTVAANGAGSPLFLWDQGWLGKLTDDIPVDHLLPVLLALPSIGLNGSPST